MILVVNISPTLSFIFWLNCSAWVTSRMGRAITASAPWEAWEAGYWVRRAAWIKRCSSSKCVQSYFKSGLRIVCGWPWSLFVCQGNFFLCFFTGACDRTLTIVWLWPQVWTSNVLGLIRHQPKRPLCQPYLVSWCPDVLMLLLSTASSDIVWVYNFRFI